MNDGNNPYQPNPMNNQGGQMNSGQYQAGAQPVVQNFQQPMQPMQPGQPMGGRIPQVGGSGEPYNPKAKKEKSGIVKTVLLVLMTLIALTFIGLFIWMYVQWDDAKTDVDGQVNLAVAEAKNELQTKLEAEFEEKEKYPFKTFAGPVDYGQLTFEYPKTWSVYIPDDASRGGEFNSYLNPDHVDEVKDENIMALRVSIKNDRTEEVLEDFNDKVEDGEMVPSMRVVNGINVNIYTGLLDSDYYGIVCIFKIRDKTAIIQTDAYAFTDDYYRVLDTIRFNA